MKKMMNYVMVLGLFSIVLPAFAVDVISPDRPGFADGTKVVGKGRFQLETGLQYERDSNDGLLIYGTSTPSLFRIGINDSLELRISSDGWMRQSQSMQNAAQKTSGVGDSSLGLKWRLMDANESLSAPSIALIANMDFATGSKTFRGDGARPSLKAVAEWELSDEITFGSLIGVYSEKNSLGKKYTGAMVSASLSGSINEQWGTFLDVAAEKLMAKKNGDKVLTVGTGLTYLMNQDVQIDFSVTKGLTSAAPKTQVGMGLSIRF